MTISPEDLAAEVRGVPTTVYDVGRTASFRGEPPTVTWEQWPVIDKMRLFYKVKEIKTRGEMSGSFLAPGLELWGAMVIVECGRWQWDAWVNRVEKGYIHHWVNIGEPRLAEDASPDAIVEAPP